LAEKIPAWFGSAVARYLPPEIMRIVDRNGASANPRVFNILYGRKVAAVSGGRPMA
jgi:hypothetical protein